MFRREVLMETDVGRYVGKMQEMQGRVGEEVYERVVKEEGERYWRQVEEGGKRDKEEVAICII